MISINLCNNKFYDAFLSLDSKKTGEKQRERNEETLFVNLRCQTRLPVIRHLSRGQTSRIRESVSRGLDWCGGDDTQIPESKHTYVRPRDIGRATRKKEEGGKVKTRKSSPLVFRVTHRASDGSEPTKITSNPSIPAVCRFSNLLANLLREKERRENRIVKFFSIRCDFDEGKKKKRSYCFELFCIVVRDWLIECSDRRPQINTRATPNGFGQVRRKFGQPRANSVNVEQPRTI